MLVHARVLDKYTTRCAMGDPYVFGILICICVYRVRLTMLMHFYLCVQKKKLDNNLLLYVYIGIIHAHHYTTIQIANVRLFCC